MKKLYYFLAGLAVAVTGYAYVASAAPITPVTGGGTGTSTIPANGAILIGNGTGYQFVQSSTFGGGGGVASTSPFIVGNLVVVSSSGALASISSGTYYLSTNPSGYVSSSSTGLTYFFPATSTIFLSTNTGNWAGTWQGTNSSTFYLASNPSGYITTSTFNATGTAFYFPYWSTSGNALSQTSSISIATSTGYICIGCTNSTNALSVDQNNGQDENLWIQNFANGNAVFVTANASSNYSAFNVYGTGQQWRFGQNGSTNFTLTNIGSSTTPFTVSPAGLTTLSLGSTLNGVTTLGSTTNALTLTNGSGVISGYAATSCGAGTAFTGLSATGTPTCTSYAPSTTIPTIYGNLFVSPTSSVVNGEVPYYVSNGSSTVSATSSITITPGSGKATFSGDVSTEIGILYTHDIVGTGGRLQQQNGSGANYFAGTLTIGSSTTGASTLTVNGTASTTGNMQVGGNLLDASGNKYVTSTSGGLATTTVFSAKYLSEASSSNAITNSPLYNPAGNDITLGSSTDNGLFSVVNASNTIVLQVASTTNNANIVQVLGSSSQVYFGVTSSGIPLFLGTSTAVAIGGSSLAIDTCTSTTSIVPFSLNTSTDIVGKTTPIVPLNPSIFQWNSWISQTGVNTSTVTTQVCDALAAGSTPTSTKYLFDIERISGM